MEAGTPPKNICRIDGKYDWYVSLHREKNRRFSEYIYCDLIARFNRVVTELQCWVHLAK